MWMLNKHNLNVEWNLKKLELLDINLVTYLQTGLHNPMKMYLVLVLSCVVA